jgi:SAM-dependent methyltransferase
MSNFSERWRQWRAEVDLDEYQTRWDRLEAAGHDIHGEADFVWRFGPTTVLDAGCGMGRIGIELARRGASVTGVDLDPELLERARQAAPGARWVNTDLATLDLGETFDVVVLAGNVIPFVAPDDQPRAVARCAAHVRPGGRLIAGFSLRAGWPTALDYERWTAAAGLTLTEAHLTWDGHRHGAGLAVDRGTGGAGGDYRVFVHEWDQGGPRPLASRHGRDELR